MTRAGFSAIYRDEKEIGAILFNAETGESYGLNPVAKAIWEGASAGVGREGIFEMLRQRFAGVPESARNDIDELINMLLNKGLLQNVPENNGGI